MSEFKEISPSEIRGNLITLIRDEWALICAGNREKFNMMTASWGFFGEMWGKDCVTVAIRPQRYTYGFVESNDTFALCFMGSNKSVHKICGNKSGRDIDKAAETGLTPLFSDGTVYFGEARLVIIVKKIYADDLKEDCFCDKSALKWYNNDLHKMFVGEIIKVLEK